VEENENIEGIGRWREMRILEEQEGCR